MSPGAFKCRRPAARRVRSSRRGHAEATEPGRRQKVRTHTEGEGASWRRSSFQRSHFLFFFSAVKYYFSGWHLKAFLFFSLQNTIFSRWLTFSLVDLLCRASLMSRQPPPCRSQTQEIAANCYVLCPGQDIILYCKFIKETLQYRWCTIQGLIPPADTISAR